VEKILTGVPAQLNTEWGTDHGTWSILKHLYPKCDIPVIQLSLDAAKSEREHYGIGQQLLQLRKEKVLIIGSGNIVHNLYEIDPDQYAAEAYDWAVTFDAQVKKWLDDGENERLISYAVKSRQVAAMAVPTNEHYLPMLYVAALRQKGEQLRYIYEGFQHRSISMRSFVVE
jgi:4,5-DOPA dioxygenase extradiol